jgi:hypothetical protein
MILKQILAGLFTFSIFGLSIYFIVMFFQDYDFTFLICGIVIPIISLLISSQYFAARIFTIIIVIGSIVGFYYVDSPYNYLPASLGIYLVLFKMIRLFSGLTGNYIDRKILIGQDFRFISELLNSDWFKNAKDKSPFELNIDELINQSFYKRSVIPIIDTLVDNNKTQFSSSSFSKEGLMKIHAIGTLHGLPLPVVKNPESITSTGTQLLLNIFGNIESINEFGVKTNAENVYVNATYSLKENSKRALGEVTSEELKKILEV